ncbi:VWA domain-containing protein [Metallumcola ferriviriculae]|uniref:VWA domain-containing protein n=1 Tax=Metallumcola ferriviriculae TaxID=3039180 RepID=A0AAU0UMY8_9FIRM|nr:VWA domain-containing protein [Desulfitibacteraceae bacterium MK1]
MVLKRENVKNELPLQAVKLEGDVSGMVGEFSVTQVYENKGNRDLEVIYTFPLPDNAVVTGFEATVGDAEIKSEIREKAEAFKVYNDAVRRGDSALLVEQYRPNIFQISLGQVQPGDKITVTLAYLQELSFVDREIRMTIPTVVAPRYIPGVPAGKRQGLGTVPPTDRVPNADFITPPIGDVDYTLDIAILIDPPKPLDEVISPSHEIEVEESEGDKVKVYLSQGHCALDRDIIIACQCTEESSAKGMVYQKDDSGYILLSFVPDLAVPQEEVGKDYIFLIDISGSMAGVKLQQAKDALNLCLRNLSDLDSFNIIAFDDQYRCFSRDGSVSFNQKSLDRASHWINNLQCLGGTEIFEPIRYALSNSAREGSHILLLTDGQVGNEKEILGYVKKQRGRNTIFTFGVDTAVNEFFINELARVAGGKPEFIFPGERIEDKVLRQFARVNSPIVEDVEIDWGELVVSDVYPDTLPRLFDMEPLLVTAKYQGKLTGDISIKGKVQGEECRTLVNLSEVSQDIRFSYLEKFWAAGKIKFLEDTLLHVNPRREDTVKQEIIDLSIDCGIGSSLTSFVAVHERKTKAKGFPETVVMPVAAPRGWGMFDDSYGEVSLDKVMCEDTSFNEVIYQCVSPSISERSVPEFDTEIYEDIERNESGIEDTLRKLALSQRADGSFIDGEDDDDLKKVGTTALAVAALVISTNKGLYKRQLRKAVKYLLKVAETAWDRKEQEHLKTYAMTLFALRSTAVYGVLANEINSVIRSKVLEVGSDYLQNMIDSEEVKYIEGEEIKVQLLPDTAYAFFSKMSLPDYDSKLCSGLAWQYIDLVKQKLPERIGS